ncbi:hypothetical protein E2C01_039701 [Portunus trituberculatus]|uniref:Uncharacterized protein n=1 Tax=Portunus trituberculatus TaxID=210409 RepID=A0A5B7FKP6_PORTR|nr:hypothetical protein [Portunus trituberculatus]
MTSNQLGGGAAKWEPGIKASTRNGFMGTVPQLLTLQMSLYDGTKLCAESVNVPPTPRVKLTSTGYNICYFGSAKSVS